MNAITLTPADPRYPAALARTLGKGAPASLAALGNLDLRQRDLLALFCSVKCPGNLILQLYDLAQTLRDQNIPVTGGFNAPMEKECLRLLLRGTQPVIVVLARNLGARQILPEWRGASESNRLLVFSPFDAKQTRISAETSAYRNRVAAALAAQVFIAYAAPRGRTEQFAQEIIARRKPVWTFAAPENANLLTFGARAIHPVTEALSEIARAKSSSQRAM